MAHRTRPLAPRLRALSETALAARLEISQSTTCCGQAMTSDASCHAATNSSAAMLGGQLKDPTPRRGRARLTCSFWKALRRTPSNVVRSCARAVALSASPPVAGNAGDTAKSRDSQGSSPTRASTCTSPTCAAPPRPAASCSSAKATSSPPARTSAAAPPAWGARRRLDGATAASHLSLVISATRTSNAHPEHSYLHWRPVSESTEMCFDLSVEKNT
mmetsp:Transcript_93129/g.247372  ORF Transcript_93129/g.247372 Transcript_93129/m.247372 type:complete len:217 (+) Transcript_93129:1385-2035(+)